MNFKINKRGDIPVTILVIGVILVCAVALFSFISTTINTRNSFTGIGLIGQMNSQIEASNLYASAGFPEAGQKSDIRSAINYAKGTSVEGQKCNCGDNCNSYADYLSDSAAKNGIDPLLLLALMMQESTCVPKAFSGSSVGLMQINLIHCGEYNLPKDKDACRKELEKPEVNIQISGKMLKGSYDYLKEGLVFQGCTNRNIAYYGWEKALRAYNGWGCDPSFKEQDYYVDQVMKRYNTLKKTATGNYVEEKRTEGILFWSKEITSFSVEYKGSS